MSNNTENNIKDKAKKKKQKNNHIKLWAVFFWLLLWQVLSMIIDKEILLVSPISAITELLKRLGDVDTWDIIWNSFARISMGFFFAFLGGTTLAVISNKIKTISDVLAPVMLMIKSVPVASFIILCLIWLDTQRLSTFISFLMVFPIIYTNALEGIQNTDKKLYEMLEVFRVPPLKRMRYVYLSQVMPYILSASKVSVGLCWKAGIAAEVIGVPTNSIGGQLYLSKLYLDMSGLFAWTLVIVILSMVFEKIVLRFLMFVKYRLENY